MDISLICTDNESWALGMRSISAVLKTAGHATHLIFLETAKKNLSNDILIGVNELVHKSDVIGFSCMAQGSVKAKQVIKSLRHLNKLIVWGGVHSSLNPADCADWADIVCRGEGEGMILELIDYLEQGKEWKDIKNIAYKDKGIVKMNDLRPVIRNLDDLPLPDFSFDSEYHLSKNSLKKVISLYDVERNGQIAFNGSRGCVFRCTYCCNLKLKNLYGGRDQFVRRMSVQRLIEHSQNLRKAFPNGKYIYFIDEDFTSRPLAEIVEFAEEFPKRVGLPFECLGHPSRITPQKMDMLVKAGLWRIRLGVETGSERTKKEIYDRHVSNEVVIKAAKIINAYEHVVPIYFFIIANPYEEKEDLLATLRLMETLPDGANIQAFDLVFFPGSEIYERVVKDGIIKGDIDSGFDIDYRSGLHYKDQPWKRKNLYLNGILFLAEGRCTNLRVGTLPRKAINFLALPNVISFNEKHTLFIRILVFFKDIILDLRHLGARWLKRILRDPTAVYNFGYFLRYKLTSKTTRSQSISEK